MTLGDEMTKIMRHPVTTAVEYIAATVFTLLYVVASTVPKYEEVFGLMLFTIFLAVGSLFVSLTNPRPIMNTVVFTVLCFSGWVGCTLMLHREYGYKMTDIPALWIGVLISGIACLFLFGVNKAGNWCRRRQKMAPHSK